ncbi:hypothetical protein DAPPUDRAFT_322284 [Daphnia pulex]|uniref:Uncharacterized protein n=1 Tax=Daphnia pulex TaxID=6669 RepID=E9GVG5_DAPPU|nr:hypothetical protein DAPPUDRAFT_322284 [Daphnia pulex]|eukprot:EFX76535.1 hypothetical protein DAPPUDRAFT_322284 [Daphnia pulex]
MARSFNLIVVLVVALSAVQATVIREEDVARLLPEGRANTVITVVTTTATGPTTVVKSTRLVCATLVAPISTTACRRKRQFWNAAPLFFAVGQDDVSQFDGLNPTQVLQVEPSVLPAPVEYRNRPAFRPIASQQFNSPFAIQSSLSNKVQPLALRVADPFFGAARFSAFSSLFSNIISSILTPAVTSTSTKTVYTTTVTSTSITSTAVYTLVSAQCLPAGVNVCPATPTTPAPATTSTTSGSTTTGTSTTSGSTTTGTSTTTGSTTTDTTTTTTTPATGK